MKTEIAVIGGGASGLMAAITAKKSGKYWKERTEFLKKS